MLSKPLADSQSEALCHHCHNGEEGICEQLLSTPEHRQRVERIARKHTKGTSVSWEDAAQAAYIKVFQAVKAGKFRQGGVREFYRWAATVAQYEIIDLVRKEKHQNWTSLDQNIPGTNLPWLETVADEFSLLDAVERTDLVFKAIEAIAEIDQRYPDRGYLKLWLGLVEDKTQSQLAKELGLTQGTVSKRWKELLGYIAEALGLLSNEDVKQELQATRKHRAVRARAREQW